MIEIYKCQQWCHVFLFLDRYKKKDGDDFTQIRTGRVTRKTLKLNIIANISISVMNGFLLLTLYMYYKILLME